MNCNSQRWSNESFFHCWNISDKNWNLWRFILQLQKKINEHKNASAPPLSRQHDAVLHVPYPSNISERAVNPVTWIPTEIEIVIRHFRVTLCLCFKTSPFHMKMSLIFMENEHVHRTHYHINGLAPGLCLPTQRRKATRKWRITISVSVGIRVPELTARSEMLLGNRTCTITFCWRDNGSARTFSCSCCFFFCSWRMKREKFRAFVDEFAVIGFSSWLKKDNNI